LFGADCIRSQHFDRAMIIAVAQERCGLAVKNPLGTLVGSPRDPEIISILQWLAAMQINPPTTIVTIE
jgi:hypothetical protein